MRSSCWARRGRRRSGTLVVRSKVLTEVISETRVGRIYTEILADGRLRLADVRLSLNI